MMQASMAPPASSLTGNDFIENTLPSEEWRVFLRMDHFCVFAFRYSTGLIPSALRKLWEK